jgi:hypothetical protein
MSSKDKDKEALDVSNRNGKPQGQPKAVAGVQYLKSLRAPFPHAALIPTDGVNAAHAPGFLTAGLFAVGVDRT